MAQYISDEEEITGSTLSEETEQVSSGEEFCIIDDLGLGISVRYPTSAEARSQNLGEASTFLTKV